MNQEPIVLNPKDAVGLQRFFQTHAHLSTNDQAQIADVSSRTIRRLRKRAGVKGMDTKARPPTRRKLPSIPTGTVPDNWREDGKWLAKMIQVYNVSQLAKMVERNRNVIKVVLKRHGIKTKTLKEATRSKNPCCNHAWCHKNYVQLGYSQQKCANLAGIGQLAFSDWLNRFKIPVRDNEQAHTGRKGITIWEKDLIARLRQQKTVRRVYVRDGYIHVRYMNYFWENYYTRAVAHTKRPYTYFRIGTDNTRLQKIPAVYPEYGVGLDGEALFPAHISLSRQDLKAASLIETRLAIHEYARQIISRGWIQPLFPEMVLKEDLDRVAKFDLSKYLENGGFTAFPKLGMSSPPGRRVMMNFFDFSPFWEILSRPRLVVRFLNTLARRKVKFNFFNFLLTVAANEDAVIRKASVQIPDPVVYAAIFKKLKLEGTLLDVSVGMGNRAVAAAVSGLRYTTPDPAFDEAISRGFLEFTGLEFDPYIEQKVDVVLYDEGFKPPDMKRVLPFLDLAKKLLVFCPHTHAQEVLKYKPKTAIRVRTKLFRKTPDYIFVW